MMKTNGRWLGLILAIAFVLSACATNSTPSSTGNITAGELFAMTGRNPAVGAWELAGAEAGLYDINQHGGVLGRKVVPVLGDTGADPVDAVPAWDQIQLSHPTFMLGPSSLEVDGVLKFIDPTKVPTFMVGGATSIDHNTNKYLWRPSPSDSTQTAAMAAYAISKHYMNCGIMMEGTVNSYTQVAPLTADYTKAGAKVLFTTKLAPAAASYRTEVAQAFSGQKPDCIFISVDPQTASTLFAAFKELNDYVPFIGDDTVGAVEVANAIGVNVASKWLVGMAGASPTGPAYQQYVSDQKAAAPQDAPFSISANVYDGAIIAALAMTAANSTDPTVWVDKITAVTNPPGEQVNTYADGVAALKAGKKINYEGATGPDDFDKYHNVFGSWDVVQFDASEKLQTVTTITAEQIASIMSAAAG